MLSKSLTTLSLLSSTVAAETVLGVYMFHRHGDRTAKSTPPANLTDLGYQEVWTSGDYYRSRYISSDSQYRIYGINEHVVKQSQISVSSSADTVLQNSATGFLQGLYPPVGDALGSQTLANGTNVTSPLNGYQLIPISLVSSGSGSEDNGWLQSASGCGAATTSSNDYFYSTQYDELLSSTQDFYDSIAPVINNTFAAADISFKNAYTIYDLINVATIHNASIQSDDLLTSETLFQLRTLADAHEWGLAYNASNDMRAIAGMTLGAEIVQFLNTTIAGNGKSKLGIQFGAYGTFGSFFGLADLQAADPDFYGISDYASVMSFELVTNSTFSASSFPSADDISVRFLFHNGTTSAISPPTVYPLFGGSSDTIGWNDFVTKMDAFSLGTTQQWCSACGNSTGTCAAYVSSSGNSSSPASAQSQQKSNGLSPAVNGVIGAMVTLAVVLGLEALVLVVGGYRVISKKRLARPTTVQHSVEPKA